MPSTYSPLKIELPATGEQSGTWGNTTNTNLGTALEEAIVGSADVTFASGNVTLTLTDTNASQEARNLRLNLIGTTGGSARTLTVPAIQKLYLVSNNCADSITIQNATGAGVIVPAGTNMLVYNDGTDLLNAITYFTSIATGSIAATQLDLVLQGDVRFQDASGGQYVAFQAPATVPASYTLTWPDTDGDSGQALVTDGSGVLSWSTSAAGDVYGPASATDNAIARFDGTTGKIIQNSAVTIADTTGDMAGIGNMTITGTTVTCANGLNFDSNTFVIDATNNRIGVGTASPANKLDIRTGTTGNIATFFGTSTTHLAIEEVGGAMFLDANNGIANLGFKTNDTERMRIDSSGNVGIGTSSPTAGIKLEVNGIIATRNTAPTVLLTDTTATVGVNFGLYNGGALFAYGQIGLRDVTNSQTAYTYSAGASGYHNWFTNGSERMRITSTGNVGIGTSSPAQKLDVAGATTAGGIVRWNASGGVAGMLYSSATQAAVLDSGTGQNGLGIVPATNYVYLATAGAERMRIDSSGNLLVGTTTNNTGLASATKQIIYGSTATDGSGTYPATLSIIDDRAYNSTSPSAGGGIAFGYKYSSGGLIALGSSIQGFKENTTDGNYASALRFLTRANGSSPAERMRIDSSGNVGVGTTSPATKLDVQGTVTIRDTSTTTTRVEIAASSDVPRVEFVNSGTYSGSIGYRGASAPATQNIFLISNQLNSPMAFYTNNTERMRLDASGNLGLGVTPSAWVNAPSFSLGNGALSGTVQTGSLDLVNNAYFNGSSYLYKTTNFATFYRQTVTGQHVWYQAPSGTAGATATFTQAMTLNASGNLGIGTTSPSKRLEITAAYGSQFRISRDVAPTTQYSEITGGGSTMDFSSYSELAHSVFTWTSKMSGSSAERMRIDSSGNVGIGTSSPTIKLDVSGTGQNLIRLVSTNTESNIRFDNSGATTNLFGTAGAAFYWYSGGSERMRIDSSGNVGIGVTPSAWSGNIARALQVGNTVNIGNGFSSSYYTNNAYYNGTNWIYQNSSVISTLYAMQNSTSAYAWNIAPAGTAGNAITFTQAMTLDASGNLLVGTTSVSDSAKFTLSAASGAVASFAIGTTALSNQILFRNPNGVVGTIQTSASATAYNTSSDYRLKENIAPMTGALDKVAQLKPVTYNWKADGSSGQGFIAHELQAVVPDCVTGEKDAVDAEGKPVYQGIDTSFLVATLTKAIQEQQSLIENLTTRLNALEGK